MFGSYPGKGSLWIQNRMCFFWTKCQNQLRPFGIHRLLFLIEWYIILRCYPGLYVLNICFSAMFCFTMGSAVVLHCTGEIFSLTFLSGSIVPLKAMCKLMGKKKFTHGFKPPLHHPSLFWFHTNPFLFIHVVQHTLCHDNHLQNIPNTCTGSPLYVKVICISGKTSKLTTHVAIPNISEISLRCSSRNMHQAKYYLTPTKKSFPPTHPPWSHLQICR